MIPLRSSQDEAVRSPGAGFLFRRKVPRWGAWLVWLVTVAALPSTARAAAGATAGATAAASLAAATPDTQSERRWVTHLVVPSERLEDISARYGVAKAEIIRWNKALQTKAWIFAGQKLRVYARRVPPPRQKIRYVVQRGDTWQGIASKFNVREGDLHYWNRKVPRQFKAGTSLTVYTNPVKPAVSQRSELGEGKEGDPTGGLEMFYARPGGLSLGAPNRGRLQSGVQLPANSLYTVRDPDTAWGSSHAIEVLVNTITQFRRESGFSGGLIVGAISKRSGGRFRPHRSHQSGRDVDIRLPKIPGAPKGSESPLHIDWVASWYLIKAFADSKEVEYIFLDYARQRKLYAAARSAGATKAELEKLVQFPAPPNSNNGLVRHAKGHTLHIHVRIKCAKYNSQCLSY